MGRDAHVKVLLSQQNPQTVSRVMAYYDYFFAARTDLLASYRETLAGLEQLETEISQTSGRLEDTMRTLQQQREALADAQVARKQAVAGLSADIASKGSQLQQLERDRGKLEELLKALEEAVANLKVPADYQAFAAARGKMPWPLAGQPSNRFGTSRNAGKMRWQGLTIPAREGTPVHAIHHGRVVYADWFRGSGLLLIIDHGDGYMSLYAHNQSLLREVGEWVTAGTPIGTVGSSGGLDKPALYFEIRHNGKPTNPSAWCRS
jgi:septal ring factor EnvC (AmiA/AmiB activator)